MPIPFPEFIRQEALDGIAHQRTYRRFFIAEQPQILVRILVVVTDIQRNGIRPAIVVYRKGKIIDFVLFPCGVLNDLVLVIQGVIRTRKEQAANEQYQTTTPLASHL